MKLLRFVFGRFFIITLLVAVQAAAFVASVVFFDRLAAYYYINLGFSVLGVFIILTLIGRGINPNYIVPWIVFVLAVPVTGVVVYLMFSQNRLSRRQKKRYRKTAYVADYTPQPKAVTDRLAAADKVMSGQSRYLLTAAKLPVYDDTCCRYYSDGESFFAALKEELNKAEKYIFMEYFLIKRGIMWDSVLEILKRKAAAGIEVRIMYDEIGSLNSVKSGYCKTLRRAGLIGVRFNRFLPFISSIHNNRDHRKTVVIDGRTGFMGGSNLSDEYINAQKKYGYFKDSAIMLKGGAVRSMAVMFLQMYNAQTGTNEDFAPYLPRFKAGRAGVFLSDLPRFKAEKTRDLPDLPRFKAGRAGVFLSDLPRFKAEETSDLPDLPRFIAEKTSDLPDLPRFKAEETSDLPDSPPPKAKEKRGFVQPFGGGPMPLYQEKVAQTAILNMINQAENYVYITTPYLIVDFQLIDALKRAAKRGVDVSIITPHIPDKKVIFLMTRSSYRPLIEAGVKIYEYLPGFMHSKNFLADDKTAIIGTINMDYRSLVHHFECGTWLYDCPCISQIKRDFCLSLSVSRLVTKQESRLNPFQSFFCMVLQLFAPLL